MFEVFCDGGSRGNPGHAAYGFIVKSAGRTIHQGYGYLGIATNNFAEYTALIKALTWLKDNHPGADLRIFLDSNLVVSQLTGTFKVKSANIKNLVKAAQSLSSSFSMVTYQHIPRIQNQEADKLVNLSLDQYLSRKTKTQRQWN